MATTKYKCRFCQDDKTWGIRNYKNVPLRFEPVYASEIKFGEVR